MNVLQTATVAQANWEAQMMDMGQETYTTFYSDFTIADLVGGAGAVKDTYKHAFDSWEHNIKYITELSLVLNHKCWEHYHKGNQELSMVYQALWGKHHNWCMDHLKGDDLTYYIQVTD